MIMATRVRFAKVRNAGLEIASMVCLVTYIEPTACFSSTSKPLVWWVAKLAMTWCQHRTSSVRAPNNIRSFL